MIKETQFQVLFGVYWNSRTPILSSSLGQSIQGFTFDYACLRCCSKEYGLIIAQANLATNGVKISLNFGYFHNTSNCSGVIVDVNNTYSYNTALRGVGQHASK
jgi:hypothetical protein